MSSLNEGNEPPDKTKNIAIDIVNEKNISVQKPKNSRFRSDDSDITDYENNEKKTKTSENQKTFEVFDSNINFGNSTKTTIENLQTAASKTLMRDSLLDRNPFAILDTDEDTNDLAAKVSNNINVNQFGGKKHSGKNTQKQRIPPITITKPFKNPKEAISNIQKMLDGKVVFKILKEGYNVTLQSLEAHSSLKEFLAKQNIPFYTFTTMDKKPLRLVLKGVHHSYTPNDITDDLLTQKAKVIDVHPMFGKGKVNMDMFIVNFEQGTKITELTKTIKYVCHQSISWHQFVKKDVGTQCRKCQRFGHAASNCGLEYRCVKCTERHAPGDCPLEDDQPAKCVNCNDAHPASYKKCPVYTKYAENLKKPQKNTGKNMNKNNASNANFSSKSPMVNSNVSYSQALKSNANTSGKENNINFMSNEINGLFDCTLTELLHKIQSFVPQYKKVTDVMMKKMMIIDFLSQFT